jgi:2'-5' RNA ligase
MTYLAITYPNIGEADLEWIQSIRQMNDRQFKLVRPHITLVFGTDKLNANELTDHVQNKVRSFKSFQIILDSAKIVEDNSKSYFHAFLIPSVGLDEINELHDLLYQDELESELRVDIPFVPHLTIGSGNKDEMTTLVDNINESNISIKGTVDQVSMIGFDGVKVTNINELSLA